jgi:hypothetical protein
MLLIDQVSEPGLLFFILYFSVLQNIVNTGFVPHGGTLKIRKIASIFKLDDKNLTLSGESPFRKVLESVKNITL